jgi:hypothetical protein
MLSRASGTQHPSGSQRVGCNLTQDVGRVDAEHFSSAEDRNAQPGGAEARFLALEGSLPENLQNVRRIRVRFKQGSC